MDRPPTKPARAETPDFAAMMRRMIAAHGRRVADGDPVDLLPLMDLHAAIDAALQVAVDGLRERHSWAQIAEPLPTTRQAAQMRWGK